jgi:hypothetical protein
MRRSTSECGIKAYTSLDQIDRIARENWSWVKGDMHYDFSVHIMDTQQQGKRDIKAIAQHIEAMHSDILDFMQGLLMAF